MTNEQIIETINRQRINLGMSRRELAKRAGVSEGLIEQIEYTRQRKSLDSLISICDSLGLKIEVVEK